MSVTSSTWDPNQYLKFSDERVRPALDLLARVPLESARLVIDLGCGTGNMTTILKHRFAAADVLGVDGSESMLAKARAAAPACRFEIGDFATWAPASAPDLIFSNAALHWVTHHEVLFPRLVSLLAPGGVLAVQMPAMHDAPLRRLQIEVSRQEPFAAHMGEASYARDIPAPGTYYDLIRPLVASLDIWETTYLHVLRGDDAITEWAAGSSLRPFLDRLPTALRGEYRAAYSRAVAPHYPRRADGMTLLPFKRFFLVART
jgi:trans-aconitate 2-methyltransferase